MSDDEGEKEPIRIDYDELDPSGFKKVELSIWNAWMENVNKPEDDRVDADGFVDEYSENEKLDKARVKYVCTMGIYAGARDEFSQRSGKGKAWYPNGDTYDGGFFDGNKNGRGVYVYTGLGKSEVDTAVEKLRAAKPQKESTDEFVTRTAKHLQVGTHIIEGILEFGYLPCYHGEYLHGLRNGDGVMKNKDGSLYKGQWKNNRRHGQGIMYYLNGDVYSGMWHEGLRHGFGTYLFAGGHGEYKGEWLKGFVMEGQWRMCDDITYEGKFEKNYPHDDAGIMHFPATGLCMKGVYKKNLWAPLLHYSPSELVKDELPQI
eukprot:PhM_4_TR10069/c0_g1_i1/m.103837/K19755/RSPH1; radial spoke head protein 1